MSHGKRQPVPVSRGKPAPLVKTVAPGNPALQAIIDQVRQELMANGIYTKDQMEAGIQEGLRQGWDEAWTEMIKTVYAATAYVMRHVYGWGAVRLSRLMDEIDQRVYTTISHRDIVEQLDEEYSIHMDLEDMIHRIVITGPGRGQKKCRE